MSFNLEDYPRHSVEVYSYMKEIVKRIDGVNIKLEQHDSFLSLLERIMLEEKYEGIKENFRRAEEENKISVMLFFNSSNIHRFYVREPDIEDKIVGLFLVGQPNEMVYKQFYHTLTRQGLKIVKKPLNPEDLGEVYYYDSGIRGYLPLNVIKEEYKKDISGPILIGGYDY